MIAPPNTPDPAVPSLAPLILIVEDEPKLASLMADYLAAAHFRVETLAEGGGVVERVRAAAPDLLLLDLMLPGKDGLTICREIRAFSSLPVIMITARSEEIDRLLGLELGADDYICKPFSPREMVARVKAILRRTRVEGPSGPASSPAGLRVDATAHQAWCDSTPLDLTPAEFRLLHLFSAHPGRAFTREQLLDALYDDKRVVTDRTVDTHVKNLRRKLEQAGAGEGAGCITSVYGLGYRFDPSAV